MKKTFYFICILFLSFAFTSCHFFETLREDLTEDYNSRITEVYFDKSSDAYDGQFLNVLSGDSVYLPLCLNPSEYQSKVTVDWEIEEGKDCIEIDTDNYGVIVHGMEPGFTWIKAKCNSIIATCLIAVIQNGDDISKYQYIYSNDNVCEIKTNTSMTVTASLLGGTVPDMEQFEWFIADPTVASISYSRNNCIISGLKPGSTQLTCSHPKSEYDYTFIVFVYTDSLTVPYLTTNNNVITLDKNTVDSKMLTVDLKNPYSSNYMSGFEWSFADDKSSEIISLIGNRNQAEIRPLKNGIAKIKVTHNTCDYPLYIYVRVNTIVKNTYINVSDSTLIIDGSDNLYTIRATLENYDSYVSPDSFEWIMPDDADEYVNYSANGNVLNLYGKKNGKFNVTVRNELSEYPRNVIIICQNQIASAIDSSIYITTSQNYVQTQVGNDSTSILVSLVGGVEGTDNVGDESTNFTWWIKDGIANDIINIESVTGIIKDLNSRNASSSGLSCSGELIITPLKEGEVTVVVTHPRCLYETEIKVKVYAEDALLNPVTILSDDSLIKLLNGDSVTVSASLRNASYGEENNITWNSNDSSVVSVSPVTGPSTVLNAVGSGSHQTYVSAHYDTALSDKKILVLTADTNEELIAMKAIYTDNIYLRISAGQTKQLSIDSVGLVPSDHITWTVSDSSLAVVNADVSSPNYSIANVNALKEGNTKITASCGNCESVVFNVTILAEGSSSEIFNENAGYLTTSQNTIFVEDTDEVVSVSVNGVNISSEQLALHTNWTLNDINNEDPSVPVFSLYGSGPSVQIQANKPGKSTIKVSNLYSENSLNINAKCGELYEWTDDYIVYITSDTDVVNLVNGEIGRFACALANTTSEAPFCFEISKGSDVIDIMGTTGGICNIYTKQAGQAIIFVTNPLAEGINKEILVNVANSQEELNGYKYLTTENNVVNVSQGGNITVSVNVENSPSAVIGGYSWSVDSNGITNNIISVSDSGNVAVIYGNNIGTAKVEVTNDECDFPLEIIVNVVDPVAAANDPYISCNNIISATVGEANVTISAELIGGTESDRQNFTWSIVDNTIATLYGNNDTAQIKPLKEGVTVINISHPKASMSRKVLLLCEKAVNNNYRISLTESIIKMSPNDNERIITARLINGTEDDDYDFKWWADSYDIINMNYSGGTCVIDPVSSGTVILHVSHPKVSLTKDIMVYISQYSDFAFSSNTATVYTGGDNMFISMELPAVNNDCYVSYESSDPLVCTAAGNKTACTIIPGSKSGSCTVTAYLMSKGGVIQGKAELLVVNQERDVTKPYIAFNGSTIITMNKYETRNLNAFLSGNNIVDTTSAGITWKIDNINIVDFNTTILKGSEIQIKACNSGTTIITISHKEANPISIYINVLGEDSPKVTLNYTENDLYLDETDLNVIASVTNDPGCELVWRTEPADQDFAHISAKDKKASVTPLKPGTFKLYCKLKDYNESEVYCTINVKEAEKLFFFVYDDETKPVSERTKIGISGLNIIPGSMTPVHYETVPKRDHVSKWYVQDKYYFDYKDLGYVTEYEFGNTSFTCEEDVGTVLLLGLYKEDTAPIVFSGTTDSYKTTTLSVVNSFNYYFSTDVNSVYLTPEQANTDRSLTVVNYEIRPVDGYLQINCPENVSVKNCSRSEGNTFYITSHDSLDYSTGIAKGKIEFIVNNEACGEVKIMAFNTHTPVLNGVPTGEVKVGEGRIDFDVTYKKLTFSCTSLTSDGNYSRFDKNTGCLYIGDGEKATLSFTCDQLYSSFKAGAYFNVVDSKINKKTERQSEFLPLNEDVNNLIINSYSHSVPVTYSLLHSKDFGQNNYFYEVSLTGAAASAELLNTTTKELSYVGYIDIHYSLRNGTESDFKVPVYCEVRNCLKTYTK